MEDSIYKVIKNFISINFIITMYNLCEEKTLILQKDTERLEQIEI